MHLLADADYIPAGWLRRLWGRALRQAINGQADAIIDIQRASPKSLAKYLTKYCTKPADIAGWSDAALKEYCLTIYKRRLIATFGKWYALTLSKVLNKPAREPIQCTNCLRVGTMYWSRAGPRVFGKEWQAVREYSQKAFGWFDECRAMSPDELWCEYGRVPQRPSDIIPGVPF
jgi:hypothetical protein